jgi:hypothetical protein
MDFRGNSTLSNQRPLSPYQITTASQDIYWVNGAGMGNKVFALRPSSSGTIFYSPYLTAASSYTNSAISKIGDSVIVSVSAPKIYMHNVGAASTASVQTAIETLPQPYTYGFTKVALKSPLSSGQEVILSVFNANGTGIASSSKTYAINGAVKYLTFEPSPFSGSVLNFEDIYIQLTSVAGAVIERVTVYGTPLDDLTQS